MKRTVMMSIVAIMVTVSVKGQQVFLKPMVGGALTTLVGDIDKPKMKVGLVAGAEFGYNLNETCSVTAGLLYSAQGTKYKEIAYDYWKLEYLNIPVLFNYYVAQGLAVKAGPQVGYLLSSKIPDFPNNWAMHTQPSPEPIGEWDIKDYCNKIDFSIPVGVSYEFCGFVLDARYNIGISNIWKKDESWHSNSTRRNSVVMLTLGYKIPL